MRGPCRCHIADARRAELVLRSLRACMDLKHQTLIRTSSLRLVSCRGTWDGNPSARSRVFPLKPTVAVSVGWPSSRVVVLAQYQAHDGWRRTRHSLHHREGPNVTVLCSKPSSAMVGGDTILQAACDLDEPKDDEMIVENPPHSYLVSTVSDNLRSVLYIRRHQPLLGSVPCLPAASTRT